MLNKVIGMIGIGLQVFILTGCAVVGSSKVDTSAIRTSYKAVYDGATQELNYSATFMVGDGFGTYVILEGGSEVEVDDRPLSIETSIFNDVSYIAQLRPAPLSELTKDHHFVFVSAKCEGAACGSSPQTFQNTFRFPNAIALADSQKKVANTLSPFAVSWVLKDKIQSHESVYAQLSRETSSGISRRSAYASHANGASGVVIFTTQDLASFGAGPAELQICREYYSSSIQAPAAGGDLTTRYCSGKTDISVD
ncbi:MAG: hypothetical protein A2070_02200 [Bdellovibrionales bacterium GWC1_52_8]|nr:MAG: hypothetical protein A2Z97_01885 [Bdellovibrionales bacterium GWB1_52_6]OFZ04905.1 MAG: hypothetical protein A2X97_16190 [Bdellovibrionales bacterium GWA1_52_35]OFZ40432.1 MAG: hypothetical protein A2070_02200 [Bdellovibrionales bacterium GWC1_52_8]HCM38837.1 hypothetical protein [Bdellovibrionales bacterium]